MARRKIEILEEIYWGKFTLSKVGVTQSGQVSLGLRWMGWINSNLTPNSPLDQFEINSSKCYTSNIQSQVPTSDWLGCLVTYLKLSCCLFVLTFCCHSLKLLYSWHCTHTTIQVNFTSTCKTSTTLKNISYKSNWTKPAVKHEVNWMITKYTLTPSPTLAGHLRILTAALQMFGQV